MWWTNALGSWKPRDMILLWISCVRVDRFRAVWVSPEVHDRRHQPRWDSPFDQSEADSLLPRYHGRTSTAWCKTCAASQASRSKRCYDPHTSTSVADRTPDERSTSRVSWDSLVLVDELEPNLVGRGLGGRTVSAGRSRVLGWLRHWFEDDALSL